MDSKSVYSFLLFIFAFYCRLAVNRDVSTTYRISTEIPFKIECCFDSAMKAEYVEFRKCVQVKDITQESMIVFRYSMKSLKGAYPVSYYENEFNTTGMRQYELKGETCVDLQFHSSKTWHSGTYSCRYLDSEGKVIHHDTKEGSLVLRVYNFRLQITPCERREEVELRCEVFGLDVVPGAAIFRERGLGKKSRKRRLRSPLYTNITKSGGYYNISGKTVVPLGDLQQTIECEIIPEDPLVRENTVLRREAYLTK